VQEDFAERMRHLFCAADALQIVAREMRYGLLCCLRGRAVGKVLSRTSSSGATAPTNLSQPTDVRHAAREGSVLGRKE
jgi:hypothetical protein